MSGGPLSEVPLTLHVRPAGPDDAAAVAAIYAPVVLRTPVSFEEEAPDAAEMARRMTAAPRLPWLVAVRGGTVVGYAYASTHRARRGYRWSAECSAYGSGSERGRGVGKLLYQRLLDELRPLGYVSLFAGVVLPNAGSVALHESVGFRHLGTFPRVGYKHGAWHDVGWWHLPLVEAPRTPSEPAPWGSQ